MAIAALKASFPLPAICTENSAELRAFFRKRWIAFSSSTTRTLGKFLSSVFCSHFFGSESPDLSFRPGIERKSENDFGSPSGAVFGPDFSSVGFDDPFADGQPQAGPADLLIAA